MPYHNIQQISDALDALQGTSDAAKQSEANFIVAQVQPLNDRITKLETTVTQLQTDLKKVTG